MSIQDIVAILVNNGIPVNEAKIEVKMMIEHYCNYTALDVVKGKSLDEKKLQIVKEKAEYRVATRLPVQYIMGVAYFFGEKYIVDKNVLIPRSETEELVLRAIDIIKSNSFKTILDIGTGSGCISCAIAKRTDCKISAVDISNSALNIAKQNAKNLKTDKQIEFIASDVFSNIKDRKFDLIISNPPYVPNGIVLQEEVMHEPEIALFTPDKEGLDFYKRIIKDAKNYLNPSGFVIFELGYNQSAAVYKILEENGYKNIMIEKDMAGIDRIIYGQNI